MDTLLQDLRFALRSFRKAPGFAFVAVLTLALGIGANTTIFSIISALVIDAVPFDNADRLVNIDHYTERVRAGVPVHLDDLRIWGEDLGSFESLAGYRSHGYTLGHDAADRTGATQAEGYRVTPGLFATLGARPLLGRGFLPGEDETGRDDVVLLAEHVWNGQFDADPGIVGRTVLVDGAPRTVIGVMRSHHRFPAGADLWVPLVPTDAERGYRSLGVDQLHDAMPAWLAKNAPGRDRLGVDLRIYVPHRQAPMTSAALALRVDDDPAAHAAAVRRAIASIDPNAAVSRVDTMDGVVADFLAPERLMSALLAIFAAVAVAIAAMGLYAVIAYTVERRRFEFGIRLALGARPGDIAHLVAWHGLLPAAAGLALGLLGALGVTRFLASILYGVSPTDPAVLASTAALLLATAAAASIMPARRAVRVDPASMLREE